MGCKAITPALVSLAKRLEGEPFHLIAAHCQRSERAEVMAYLRSQKYDPAAPNFTVTSFGGHPAVKGNGYVPYYMVFDHRGKLRREHMCGNYHGGDGMGMIDWVEKLLKEAPAIYLGPEPFEAEAELAAKIESGKGLGGHLTALAKKRTAATSDASKAELDRIDRWVVRWRDHEMERVDKLLASNPSGVVPALTALAKMVQRTAYAAPVDEKLKAMKADKGLKSAIAIDKTLKKTAKRLEKLKACKSCRRIGRRTFVSSCAACNAMHKSKIEKSLAQLEKLAAENATLPIAKTIEAFVASYRKP